MFVAHRHSIHVGCTQGAGESIPRLIWERPNVREAPPFPRSLAVTVTVADEDEDEDEPWIIPQTVRTSICPT